MHWAASQAARLRERQHDAWPRAGCEQPLSPCSCALLLSCFCLPVLQAGCRRSGGGRCRCAVRSTPCGRPLEKPCLPSSGRGVQQVGRAAWALARFGVVKQALCFCHHDACSTSRRRQAPRLPADHAAHHLDILLERPHCANPLLHASTYDALAALQRVAAPVVSSSQRRRTCRYKRRSWRRTMLQQQSTRRMRMRVGGAMPWRNRGACMPRWGSQVVSPPHTLPSDGLGWHLPLLLQPTWAPLLPCACLCWTPARCLGQPRRSVCPAPQPWASARGRRRLPTARRRCLAAALPASCAAASAAPSSGTSSAAVRSEALRAADKSHQPGWDAARGCSCTMFGYSRLCPRICAPRQSTVGRGSALHSRAGRLRTAACNVL